jgi:hypothetical protein
LIDIVIFDEHAWMDYLFIESTYHDVMTLDPWRAFSFLFAELGWWTILGEQA